MGPPGKGKREGREREGGVGGIGTPPPRTGRERREGWGGRVGKGRGGRGNKHTWFRTCGTALGPGNGAGLFLQPRSPHLAPYSRNAIEYFKLHTEHASATLDFKQIRFY